MPDRLLAGGAIRFEASSYLFCASPTGDNGNSLFCTRVLFHIAANFHGRTANGRPYGSKNIEVPIIVGASIARPSAAAEMLFAFKMVNVAFAPARPVRLEVILFALACCFTSLRISTGGRAMLAPTGAIINRSVIQRMAKYRKPPQDIFDILPLFK